MSTGFEKIGSDSQLQDHWIRRLIAFIIDAIIVFIGTFIIGVIVFVPLIIVAAATGLPGVLFNPWAFPFLAGLLSLAYSALLESFYGWTFGKKIMNLRVQKISGQKISLDLALIRNASKIYWILVLVDVIVGLATPGDPHQKISDRMAGTTIAPLTTPTSPPRSPSAD
ncbi:MAG: RDD family protein [Candidatus Bathyarchaeota archaeon]|nr:MAG: RDD family protein [Candidatus Bathyarchaeota archaeon]